MSQVNISLLSQLVNKKMKSIVDTCPLDNKGGNARFVVGLDEISKEYEDSNILTELFTNVKSNDILFDYDFWTDEFENKVNNQYKGSECDIWCNWYDDRFFQQVYSYMESIGYHEVECHDGSGGGLYYGLAHFTK